MSGNQDWATDAWPSTASVVTTYIAEGALEDVVRFSRRFLRSRELLTAGSPVRVSSRNLPRGGFSSESFHPMLTRARAAPNRLRSTPTLETKQSCDPHPIARAQYDEGRACGGDPHRQ
jgi:hypothetical protein